MDVASYCRKRRAELVAKMGGRCYYCLTTKRLEFHHLVPRVWNPAKCNRWIRLARYRREWIAGHVVLACRRCNAMRGKPPECVYEMVKGLYGKSKKMTVLDDGEIVD